EAKARVSESKRALDRARGDLETERQKVATLTLHDVQSNSAMNRMSSLFSARGPVELLERNTAYSSAQNAMAARMERLEASTQIFEAAQNRATKARENKEQLVAARAEARESIV